MSERLRVVLVDDDPAARALVGAALRQEFRDISLQEVTDAASLEAALERGDFDLVVSDFDLPWAPGMATLRSVKQRRPDCLVVMTIPPGRDEAAVEAMDAGLDDYLMRTPRFAARLAEAARRALALRRQREALREADARYRTLFDRIPVGLYRSTPDGTILDANPALAMLLGFPDPGALTAVRSTDLYLDPAARKALTAELAAVGVARDFEAQLRRRDGGTIWVRVNSRAVRHADGRVRWYEGTIEDITEWKRAEDALRKSGERYRAFVENSSEAIWRFELEQPCDITLPEDEQIERFYAHAYLAECNRAMASMYGYEDPREIVGARLGDLLIRTDPRNTDYLRAFIRSGYRLADAESHEVDREGRDKYFQNNLMGIVERGHVTRAWGTQRDITARKLAEEALRASQQRLRDIIEHSSNLFYAHGPDHVLTYVSPQSRAFFDCEPEEAMVKWTEFATDHPINALGYDSTLRAIETGERQSVYELELAGRQGRRIWVEVNEAPVVRDGRTVAIVGALTDITDRKRAEEEKRQLEKQLGQSQKIEAIGRLAGGVAHDFNNLLTAIFASAELLRGDMGPGDPRLEDVAEIKRAADRAAALTRQLLAFSRRQVLQPRVLDLNAVVSGMDRMLRRLIGEDIELVAALAPGLSPVHADPGQIEQVVINLALNAQDSMRSGGTLTVETRDVDVAPGSVQDRVVVKPGRYATLAVRDTGCGMDEETRTHLFEPFFTTKDAGGGTGLGLSTVYGVVKQSGGYVWVDSAPRRGTTVTIYLPAVGPAVEAAVPPPAPAEVVGGSETVLLVEDEAAVRRQARKALEELGYEVLEASGGGEAVELCRRHGSRIRLLLTDVVMPGMNGRQLVETLTPQYPGLRVQYMSAHTDDEIVRRGVDYTDTPLLQKPFTRETLARKVREALDRPG